MDDFVGSTARKTSRTEAMVGYEYKRTAPTHKTGMSGLRSEESDRTFETLITGLEKGLDQTRKAFVRYATSKGRTEAEFYGAIQQTIEQLVIEETKNAVGEVPFGKAILMTFELSQEFATGVGEALYEVNKKLEREYDFSRLSSNEVTERDNEIMLNMRRYQARATQELPDVLRKGLARVAEHLITALFKNAVETLKKVIKDVAGQIARQLIKQNDLIAIFNQAVVDAGNRIPVGRARVERLAFHFAASSFIGQLGDEALLERLKPILDATKSKEPIAVALLRAVIQTLMYGSYESYARRVPVEYGWSDLRQLLIEQARILLVRSEQAGALIEPGPILEVKADDLLTTRLTIPNSILAELRRPPGGPTSAERNRFTYRHCEYDDLRDRLRLSLQAKARQYQRQIYRASEENRTEVWVRLSNQLVEERKRGWAQLAEVRKSIIREFGQYFDGMNVEWRLTSGELIPLPDLKDIADPNKKKR